MSSGGVENDSPFNVDEVGEMELNNSQSLLESQLSTPLPDRVFVLITTDTGELQLKLPNSLIYHLEDMDNERSIVARILEHLYLISYLRTCTLTGTTKHNRTAAGPSPSSSPSVLPGTPLTAGTSVAGKVNALPADKVLLITEAARKILPPTSTPTTEEAKKKQILEQKKLQGYCSIFEMTTTRLGCLNPELGNAAGDRT